MTAEIAHQNLIAGWAGILAGVLSGSWIGLYFHRDSWLGGYGSFPRRMIRLAHISLVGLGILNILLALTLLSVAVSPPWASAASWSLIFGAITMPTCCLLCAWRKAMWPLFTVPVVAVALGILLLLGGRP